MFFFREHEMPMWEKSPEGATLIIKLSRNYGDINRYWEKLLFMCIGEIYMSLNIIGVGVSLRQGNNALLEVWLKKTTDSTHKTLPKSIHKYLEISDKAGWKTYFKKHSDALNVSILTHLYIKVPLVHPNIYLTIG